MIDRPSVHASPSARTLVCKGWARPLWQKLRRNWESAHKQEDGWGFTLLHWAACYGNATYFSHWPPLHLPKYGYEFCVRVLLLNGVNVNAKDMHGRTPLHYAAWAEHYSCVCVLLLNGADVNAKTRTRHSPLYFAADNKNESCVRVLLLNGAVVNTKGIDGRTPLDLAMDNNNQAVCELLRAAMTG